MRQSPEQIHPDIEADLEGINFRDPIVDGLGDAAESAMADRQWQVLTETARQVIHSSPEARRVATTFASEPLNEMLPRVAVAELSAVNERVSRVAQRSGKILVNRLDLAAVPDTAMVPDLSNTPALKTKDEVAKSLRTDLGQQYYQNELDEASMRQAIGIGITPGEQALVGQRYRYARDVKLLGLTAELLDQPIDANHVVDGKVEHTMASGTKVLIDAEAASAAPGLLDPSQWQGRRQMKDRVYNVTVDGQDYIMKERKTARHTDTMQGGHRDVLSSEEEFAAGQHFASEGVITMNGIQLRWEKPLGSVTFPDGYQFAMFAKESDLEHKEASDVEHKKIQISLSDAIKDKADLYQEEYEAIKADAKKLYKERSDIIPRFDSRPTKLPKRLPLSRRERRYKEYYKNRPEPDELTFDEFADAKAESLTRSAQESMRDVMVNDGFVNRDNKEDNLNMSLIEVDGKPTVELLCFDLEYYEYNPDWAAKDRQTYDTLKDTGQTGLRPAPNVRRDVTLAARYALSIRSGYKLPPQKS